VHISLTRIGRSRPFKRSIPFFELGIQLGPTSWDRGYTYPSRSSMLSSVHDKASFHQPPRIWNCTMPFLQDDEPLPSLPNLFLCVAERIVNPTHLLLDREDLRLVQQNPHHLSLVCCITTSGIPQKTPMLSSASKSITSKIVQADLFYQILHRLHAVLKVHDIWVGARPGSHVGQSDIQDAPLQRRALR